MHTQFNVKITDRHIQAIHSQLCLITPFAQLSAKQRDVLIMLAKQSTRLNKKQRSTQK